MKDYWCEESRANLKHMQLDWNLFVRCVVTGDEIHRVTAGKTGNVTQGI